MFSKRELDTLAPRRRLDFREPTLAERIAYKQSAIARMRATRDELDEMIPKAEAELNELFRQEAANAPAIRPQ